MNALNFLYMAKTLKGEDICGYLVIADTWDGTHAYIVPEDSEYSKNMFYGTQEVDYKTVQILYKVDVKDLKGTTVRIEGLS